MSTLAWALLLAAWVSFVSPSAAIETPYLLTPKPLATPRLTGAAIMGARPGHPFLFTVTATEERPMAFAAGGLPEGLHLDATTGQITGSAEKPGDYRVQVTAGNALGTAKRTLRIVIGDTLALTPPMGWNSWNCFGSTVSEAEVRAAADAFIRAGLADHGWTYINVDDFWMTRPPADDPLVATLRKRAQAQPCAGFEFTPMDDPSLIGPARDSAERINSNRRFPDMPALARYLHRLGLKAGLYSSPGPLTCGGCIGSFGHEAQDAAQFAQWGFDYLKYDWCSVCLFSADDNPAEAVKPYRLMGDALRAGSRDIVFSISNDGAAGVWKWGAGAGGNCWRVTGDIRDTWASIAEIGFSQDGRAAYAGPGHWNDADMLVVGWVGGWGPDKHATRLTPDEQYTHVSLWSLLASPLLIGCDLTRLDDFTISLLTNDEVLAVDQDPLGQPARLMSRSGEHEVWARPLADGSLAVGLFNRGDKPAEVTARWADLGLAGPQTVRDLWRQRDLGRFEGVFPATVRRHGVVLVQVAPH